MKAKAQLTIGVISLVALLAYTLVHTGGLLARYVNPAFVGYVAAFGIEASIVSLSLRIGELRKSKQTATFFIFVLVSVVIVSAIANIAEGFEAAQGVTLTMETVRQLDIVQAVIGLSATGLISLIVLALSEIVGTDVTTTIKLVEKERKATTKPATNNQSVADYVSPIDKARQAKNDKVNERRQEILSLLRRGVSKDDVKAQARDKWNVSERTIERDITALNGQGVAQ